jgi:hypothetical protein
VAFCIFKHNLEPYLQENYTRHQKEKNLNMFFEPLRQVSLSIQSFHVRQLNANQGIELLPTTWIVEDEAVINSFQAIVPLTGQEKGSFFTGAYLPQKSVLSPPIERQYEPFQKHVPSI